MILPTVLEYTCGEAAVPGRQTFNCTFSNDVASVMCVFDGGVPEPCSFPIQVFSDRFGFTQHTLTVIITDVFGQSIELDFQFQLAERKLILSSNLNIQCHFSFPIL